MPNGNRPSARHRIAWDNHGRPGIRISEIDHRRVNVLRLLLIFLVLSNGVGTPAPGARSLDSYIGGSVDELAAVMGPPDVSGDRFVWRLRVPRVVGPRRALPSPVFQGTPQGVTVSPAAGELLPPSVVPLACYIEVEVDPHGRIRAIDATGPGCRHLGNPPLSVE